VVLPPLAVVCVAAVLVVVPPAAIATVAGVVVVSVVFSVPTG